MIRVGQVAPGTLIYLPCGCGGIRGTDDPIARLPRVVVQRACAAHAEREPVRLLRRETEVSPFVQSSLIAE